MVTLDRQFVNRDARTDCTSCLSLVFERLLSTITPAERLKLEDSLCTFVEVRGGHLVAKIAGGHQYQFIFYAPANAVDPRALPIPAELLSRTTVSSENDPGWHEYESWTTDEDYYEVHDQSIMEKLKRIEDTFEVPRDVDFLWEFQTRNDADESIGRLRAAGLRVERANETTLKTVTHMNISLENLRSFRNLVLPMIAAHGVTLTFWGCYPATVNNTPSRSERVKAFLSKLR